MDIRPRGQKPTCEKRNSPCLHLSAGAFVYGDITKYANTKAQDKCFHG